MKVLRQETESQIRARVVKKAESWLGCKESDNSHKPIIDVYNSQKPLPVGYKLKYTDAWCAGFASAVAVAEKLTDIIPPECSCSRQIALFKNLGRWIEDDAYVPKPGDLVYYDWQDNGIGDNRGDPDHVGIVTKVEDNYITVIEGNIHDSVDYRTLRINGQYIRGYGIPDYASKVKNTKPADEIYIVKKGDTLWAIAQKYGTTYQELAKYNEIQNPNLIFVNQKIKIPASLKG